MAITDTLIARPTPLHETEPGVLRVGSTRVTLETVMWRYQQGRTPEEIRMSFPTLALDDICGAIA